MSIIKGSRKTQNMQAIKEKLNDMSHMRKAKAEAKQEEKVRFDENITYSWWHTNMIRAALVEEISPVSVTLFDNA